MAEVLEEIASSIPWDRAADWDVSGLTLGDPDQPVRTAGVCHEVNHEVMAALAEAPVDLLITYHPLLFAAVRTLRAGSDPGGMAFRLIKMGTSLAVAHTAFDVCPGGAADALADRLGLRETVGFGPMETAPQVKVVTFVPARQTEEVAEALASAGAGQIGNYQGCSYRSEGTGAFAPQTGAAPVVGEVGEDNRVAEVRLEMIAPAAARDRVVAALARSHLYEEPAFDLYPVSSNLPMAGRLGVLSEPMSTARLAQEVIERLGIESVRYMATGDQPARKVAVLPGSGGSFISAAGQVGAEVVVTADLSHHQMTQAQQRGVGVIDAGHAATEAPGVERLLELVAEVSPVTIDLTGIRPGPKTMIRRIRE